MSTNHYEISPEILQACEASWVSRSGFGVTVDQMLEFAKADGLDINAPVFVSDKGLILTLGVAKLWAEDWVAYSDGFVAAWLAADAKAGK